MDMPETQSQESSENCAAEPPKQADKVPELQSIMDHFSHSLSLVIVCERSLTARVYDEAVHELVVMREAITSLLDVYEEIDLAELHFGRQREGLTEALRRALNRSPPAKPPDRSDVDPTRD